MFQSISVLPRTGTSHPLDVGELAEKMFYYKTVNLFVDKEELKTLFEYFPVDLLVEFLKRGYLKIYCRKTYYGVMYLGKNIYLGDFFLDTDYNLMRLIYDAYFDYSNDKAKSKAAVLKLYKNIEVYTPPSKFSSVIDNEFSNEEFINAVVKENIKHYLPKDEIITKQLKFSIDRFSGKFLQVESNIDVEKFPFLSSDSILLGIGLAFDDINIISNYSTDISTPDLNSRIISAKFNSLIKNAGKIANEINVFNHVAFQNSPSIKSIINSKERSLEEFLALLETADKFKRWLNSVDEDGNLVQEYIAAMRKDSWIKTAESKSIRFYIVQGASTILKATGTLGGILAGLGMSAFNTFLVEKLFKEWKPNHFIEEEIIPFVANKV